MTIRKISRYRLSEQDLDFLIESKLPEVSDKLKLRQILREDEDFRRTFISDEKVFHRLMADDEIFLKISPALYFEILLRRTAQDLGKISYTIEKKRNMHIPVFDTNTLVNFLAQEHLLVYLADMLSSFTKVESYAISFRLRKGIWKKIRFNDMDIQSLKGFCEAVDDEFRFGFYKRIADICLFILGIFPDSVEQKYRYPFSGEIRPKFGRDLQISPEEYTKEGRKFYKLAAEHYSAEELELTDVFWALYENFDHARKPLNFIADQYLKYQRKFLFA
jgi:hypothetical protein